jgi:hypothetical protein
MSRRPCPIHAGTAACVENSGAIRRVPAVTLCLLQDREPIRRLWGKTKIRVRIDIPPSLVRKGPASRPEGGYELSHSEILGSSNEKGASCTCVSPGKTRNTTSVVDRHLFIPYDNTALWGRRICRVCVHIPSLLSGCVSITDKDRGEGRRES